MSSAQARPAPSPSGAFRYDSANIDWSDFFTPGTFYRILNVDLEAGTADMLVKFEANSQCMYHRHAATTQTLVLQGELRVREQVDGREVIKIKPAGSYAVGGFGEVHIEGSGDEEAIIFFGMRTDTEVIYELLNEDLSVRRPVTVADFDHDWRERWPEDTA